MDEGRRQKRPRRSFTDDFKAKRLGWSWTREHPLGRSLVMDDVTHRQLGEDLGPSVVDDFVDGDARP